MLCSVGEILWCTVWVSYAAYEFTKSMKQNKTND